MTRKAKVYQLPDDGAKHLSDIDDEFLACKASRRHNMPKLLPGKLPSGVTVSTVRRGVFQLHGTCRDCGLPGTLTTGRGGTIGTGWVYDYTALKGSSKFNGYLAPKGAGLTQADYREEYSRRVIETVRAAAAPKAPATAPRTRKPSNAHGTSPRARRHARDGERKMRNERQNRTGQVPPTRFSGGAS